MIHTVFSDEHVTVTHQPEAGLFVYERNTTPYSSIDALRAHHAALSKALEGATPERNAVLIDVRAATPRNDDAFEAEITRAVGVMISRFRTFAFLVRTAVGSLQLKRLSAANGIAASAVFTDEAAARKYLAAE